MRSFITSKAAVGDGFVGREDILRRLQELWARSDQRPSVVLYGHRRMGKTSILLNLEPEQYGANVSIVNFNLQLYGLVPSTGALLYNLSCELHDTFHKAMGVDVSKPDREHFEPEPYGTFTRYVRDLERCRGNLCLIITIDEFEILERGIRNGKLREDLVEYLRGLLTTQTWLTLAFAGLHTLREMTESYWSPLYSSVETIPVSFLTEQATRRLLTAPTPDFAIEYEHGAPERIYALTHGQPYLTQLVGHHLVTRLNTQIFEDQVAPHVSIWPTSKPWSTPTPSSAVASTISPASGSTRRKGRRVAGRLAGPGVGSEDGGRGRDRQWSSPRRGSRGPGMAERPRDRDRGRRTVALHRRDDAQVAGAPRIGRVTSSRHEMTVGIVAVLETMIVSVQDSST